MNSRRITILAMLTSLSLIIFMLEAQLPPIAPIPGIKLGLANIITLVTLFWYGRRDAFIVLMLRIALSTVFAGTMLSLLYSAAGGILCFIVMSLALGALRDKLWVLSILGAIAHNIGQIAAAAAITATWQVVAYLPILIVSAILTGTFTGIAAQIIVKRLKPLKR